MDISQSILWPHPYVGQHLIVGDKPSHATINFEFSTCRDNATSLTSCQTEGAQFSHTNNFRTKIIKTKIWRLPENDKFITNWKRFLGIILALTSLSIGLYNTAEILHLKQVLVMLWQDSIISPIFYKNTKSLSIILLIGLMKWRYKWNEQSG